MTLTNPIVPAAAAATRVRVPPLQGGDRLTRDEFERRYRATPHVKKAELIEGVVHMPPPPVSHDDHSGPHLRLCTWLGNYLAVTPGVDGGDNPTLLLDLDNEPQPDAILRILETHGGQSRVNADGYIEGPPELVAEVAATSASYDLHAKLNVYRRTGVREYVVWRTFDREIDYYVLRGSQYERLAPNPDGIHRSEAFPGLWLDAAALVRRDIARVLAVGLEGANSAEHRAFVDRLASKPALR